MSATAESASWFDQWVNGDLRADPETLAEGERFIARVKDVEAERVEQKLRDQAGADLSRMSTVDELVSFLREELDGRDEATHMVRVLTTQTDKWPRDTTSLETLAGHRTQKVGAPQWDAFLESLVAYRFHVAGLPSPAWTRVTTLDPAWWPYENIFSVEQQLSDVFRTPVEFLHRGVIFDRADLEVV